MIKDKKENSVAQIERLKHIEYLAYFQGSVSRADLKNRFSISAASSTNDFAAYNQIAPNNLIYNVRLKCYEISKSFAPVFNICTLINRLPLYTIPKLHKPANEKTIRKVALISRAIQKTQSLKITYSSASSGTTKRQIIPVAFADNLLRWHLRAYDRRREKYSDFVVNRIETVKVIEKDIIQPHEHPGKDKQWLSFIELRIKPHPNNLADSQHFDMNGKIIVKLRAATAGYFLELWNVDCSPNASLRGKQYQYVLSNLEKVSKLTDLELAPGYKNKKR